MVFLEISKNSQGSTCARASFLIKLQASACYFIKKETPAQVFSRNFCKISKNTFSYRTPLVAAPVHILVWIARVKTLRVKNMKNMKKNMKI